MAELTARQRPFPLEPRSVLTGSAFGERRSSHRGRGSHLVGSRPYRAGDPIREIDWRASARLSAARDSDQFVVREYFADEAPRVFLVVDRSQSMRLYEPPFPWLAKRSAALAAVDAIGASAEAARSPLGVATPAGVLSPGAFPAAALVARIRASPFDSVPADLARAVAALLRRRALVTPGSFVFVISDFLRPSPRSLWAGLRRAGGEPVPVVVQDPVWERSFPPVGGVTVRFADAVGGLSGPVRLTSRDARARARANERRFAELLRVFRSGGSVPVLIDSAEPGAVDAAFRQWVERRRRMTRRRA
jgi:uncharacterized protein (DUF58 family)